jgi:hypothetical protein
VAFSPIDPLTIDRDVTLNLAGTNGYFQSIGVSGSDPYTIQASIPIEKDAPGGLTANRLRAAGTDYPLGIVTRYLTVPPGAMGDWANKLLAEVVARVKVTTKNHATPYDLADEIVTELHDDSQFQYTTNVLGQCDRSSSIVECFAQYRKGYCEHYASTMAILLRAAGVPTRLVEGFLPGALNKTTGVETIKTGGAHAWVEVYFPGYGWQMFDPTGGQVFKTKELIQGTVVPLASAAPKPSFAIPSGEGNPFDPINKPGTLPVGTTATSSNPAVLVGAAIALLAAILLVAFLAWRRGPRGATTPDGVYAGVASLARRFGFGPRPTQTAYEYAAALGDILPSVRPELQTVATAKVEVAYGRRQLGEDRIHALRESYRRLRVGLLRLAFRRGDRRRMR